MTVDRYSVSYVMASIAVLTLIASHLHHDYYATVQWARCSSSVRPYACLYRLLTQHCRMKFKFYANVLVAEKIDEGLKTFKTPLSKSCKTL